MSRVDCSQVALNHDNPYGQNVSNCSTIKPAQSIIFQQGKVTTYKTLISLHNCWLASDGACREQSNLVTKGMLYVY